MFRHMNKDNDDTIDKKEFENFLKLLVHQEKDLIFQSPDGIIEFNTKASGVKGWMNNGM